MRINVHWITHWFVFWIKKKEEVVDMKKMTKYFLTGILVYITVSFVLIFSIGNAQDRLPLMKNPVLSAKLKAEPDYYSIKCTSPAKITFKGTITLALPKESPMKESLMKGQKPPVTKVRYYFFSNAGRDKSADMEELTFFGSGTKEVSMTREFGFLNASLDMHVTGWGAISAYVVCPEGSQCPKIESNKAYFRGECD
jgi:hypothetical protein